MNLIGLSKYWKGRKLFSCFHPTLPNTIFKTSSTTRHPARSEKKIKSYFKELTPKHVTLYLEQINENKRLKATLSRVSAKEKQVKGRKQRRFIMTTSTTCVKEQRNKFIV